MKLLDDVKSWMGFMGWSDGGSPGSLKRGTDGNVIASYGGKQWLADVEEAIEKTDRAAAVAELERREKSRSDACGP
jgi:hypothetical protein